MRRAWKASQLLQELISQLKDQPQRPDKAQLSQWWSQINDWRKVDCLAFKQEGKIIKPQYALSRLEALTKDRNDVPGKNVRQRGYGALKAIIGLGMILPATALWAQRNSLRRTNARC